MSEQGKNHQSSGKDSANLSQKQIREARLKKSLRANLQRRKAKMRAIKSAEQGSAQPDKQGPEGADPDSR